MDTEKTVHQDILQTDRLYIECGLRTLSPYKADHLHIHCLVWNNIEKVGLDTDTARGGGD